MDAVGLKIGALRPPPQIAIVLPCYNEAPSVAHAVNELLDILGDIQKQGLILDDSFLLFVDDGSLDNTWDSIRIQHSIHKNVKGLKLSRNFGHQAALLSGLSHVSEMCDAAISIDADLQQDPLAIVKFIQEYMGGSDVVLGIREDRQTDSFLKRFTALGFYWFLEIMGVHIIRNHADYRLLSKRALVALTKFVEPNIFLRATALKLGFRVSTVKFNVKERLFGETKYSPAKMFRLAFDGVTSTSVMPLRLVSAIGLFIFLFSCFMGAYVLWKTIIVGGTSPGWASIALPIYFIGGIQLFCLGIVGEYVGQIYGVVKNRPRWLVEEVIE